MAASWESYYGLDVTTDDSVIDLDNDGENTGGDNTGGEKIHFIMSD